MAVERRQYTAEFKQEAAQMMTRGGLSAAQVARELGINANLLSKWKRQLEAGQQAQTTGRKGYMAFPGQGHTRDQEVAPALGAPANGRMRRCVWSVMC